MRRYWIEKSQIENGSENDSEDKSQNATVHFTGEQFHHIFDVCRQEVGHHFEVITEDSVAYLVQVTAVGKKKAQAQVIETRPIEKLPLPHIHIALSVSRYPVMDSIMERAVEMGVTSILPFVSSFSFIRKEKELPPVKVERWKKIIISATQQCGRGELMSVQPVVNMNQMLEKVRKTVNPDQQPLCLFAYEGQPGQEQIPIEKEIKRLRSELEYDGLNKPHDVWIIVGSEGGFSVQEVESMRQLGLYPVTLGKQILRVETACLTLVAVLKYEFGLMQ